MRRTTKFIDETGNRYGRLLVASRLPNNVSKGSSAARWHCICDCGNTTQTTGCSLREGKATSCGCRNREILTSKYKNEIGNRYGRYTVIGYIGRRHDRVAKGVYWRCRCDCGEVSEVHGKSLRDGSSVSCGCYARERAGEINRKPHGEACRNQALRAAKRAARERHYEWRLTDEQAFTLFTQPCHYCGAIATNNSSHPDANGSFRYNGIDRVDNSIGYTLENCVACCKHCNIAKRSMTVLEFRMWIAQVYQHMRLGDQPVSAQHSAP